MKPLPTIKRRVPIVMTFVSAAGVVATAVMAAKATPKAMELIRADSRKNHDGDPYAYTKKEAIKSCWKCYIPTAAIGVSTIICIFGSTALTRRQQVSLASAYALLEKSYKEYRGKVKELYGEEAHQTIMKELAVEKAKDISIYAPNLVGCSNLEFQDADEETRLFYDSFSKRYFESTISRVLQAEYHLNRNFTLGATPSLNDFYDLLGLERTEHGDSIGWTNSDGSYYWIDFNHYKTTVDGTMECWIIESEFLPDSQFLEDC